MKMTQQPGTIEKCSSCGQPIPDTHPDCPNCGRKRKTPITASSQPVGAKKPLVAQFCTVFAWMALIFAPLQILGGFYDSIGGHHGAGGEIYSGMFAAFGSLILFAAARGITLLNEIASNNRLQTKTGPLKNF
jgi:hypothetical protein